MIFRLLYLVAPAIRIDTHARTAGPAQEERLIWRIASDRHPTAGSRLRIVVPQRLMLDAAVVPEGDRMRLPAEPALEFLPGSKLAQKVEDRAAFFSRQLVDVGGEVAVDIKRLAFCHWM